MADTPDLKRRRFLLGRLADDSPESAAALVAVIGPSCFSFRGVACMSCRDACPTGAVRFELAIGGARPKTLTDSCTGCGDCSQSCPADAIQISAPEATA